MRLPFVLSSAVAAAAVADRLTDAGLLKLLEAAPGLQELAVPSAPKLAGMQMCVSTDCCRPVSLCCYNSRRCKC